MLNFEHSYFRDIDQTHRVCVLDENMVVVECNDIFCEDLQLNKSEILNKPFDLIVDHSVKDQHHERYYLKNGKTFVVSFKFNLDGNLYLITDLNMISNDDALHIFEKLQAVAQAGYWYYEIETASLLFSSQVRKILGIGEEESRLKIDSFIEFFSDFDKYTVRDYFDRAIKKSKAFELQTRITRMNGVDIWIQLTCDVEIDEKTQEITRLYGIIKDIDLLKKVENEVISSNLNIQVLLNIIPEAVILANNVGRIISVNQKFTDIFDYHQKEIENQNLDILMPPEHAIKHDKHLKRYQETQEPHIIGQGRELRALRKDGSEFPIYLTVGDMFFDGNQMYLGIVRDLTAQHRIDEERNKMQDELYRARKLESVMTMAGGVAHDFNNALTAISGQVQLLQFHYEDNEDIQNRLAKIAEVVESATNITASILNFSSQGEAKLKSFNIHEVLKKVGDYLLPSLHNYGDITYDFGPGCEMLEGDPVVLEQVFSNLYINAKDAIIDRHPKGGGRLHIKTYQAFIDGNADRGGCFLFIEIEDNGIGIPPDKIEKIYDPFFTTKEVGKGTGLGMPFVFNALTSHRGFILVDSKINQGTKFTVAIPVGKI